MINTADILVVAAHPDDEVLGAGGTIAKLAEAGARITTVILCGSVSVRSARPSDGHLLEDVRAAAKLLGTETPVLGDFPNIAMNTVPHLELVQFIERHMIATNAQFIFTHHPSDINDDHRQVSAACQAAARLGQRRPDLPTLQALYYMEVPSSTDWTFPGGHTPFQATIYSSLDASNVDRKIEALSQYRDVMRPFPHPRSEEAIKALLQYRGGQSGSYYAEAFQLAFGRLGASL